MPKADIHACGYSTSEHLANVVNHQDYEGKPYTLSLALGEHQLSYKAFDLSVLEFYQDDPRYECTTLDILPVRTIRLLFANHHRCKDILVDETLFEGKI
ncbi:MAG: hypothetical protein QME21_16890 [Anaerolineales bacterium]|nr:hypothetical protein [Anaerolineales bacterium]